MQLRRKNQAPNVEPCDICGEVGFGEVIVTCSNCKLNREHVYCMRIILTEIPAYWLCETCKSKNVTTSSCVVKQDSGLLASGRQRSARARPTGKVKYLHADEVINLSSCSMIPTPSSSTLPMTRKAIPGSSAKPVTGRARVASRSVAPKNSSVTMKPNPNTEPVAYGKFPRNGVQKNPMADQHTSLLRGGRGQPRKEHRLVSERQLSSPILDRQLRPLKVQTRNLQIEKPTKDLSATKPTPVVVSDAVAKRNRFNMEESKNQNIHEDYHHELNYLPSSVRAWSGQFQILQNAASGELYDGFEAQPPCIVSKKAYKLSNKIPSVLQLESRSALNVLTDVFQNCSPSLQDIALYFFPSDNESSKKNLTRLLKFMNEKNSMMRSVIDGVELLVFTSHQLNEHSRGTVAAVYGGYFLWGVFRSNISVPPDMDPVDGDADMDIDMMRGNDVVGRIDNLLNDNLRSPVKKYPKLLDILDVPPCFEAHGSSGDKSILSEDHRKKIKLVDSSDPSSGSPVKKYRKGLDILDVPPGFEPHGSGACLVGFSRSRGDKSILSEDHRKKIKIEYSSDPSSENPAKKYRKGLDILDVPPGFEPHGLGACFVGFSGSSGDKSILSKDRRKKIKLEDSSDPSSGILVKKSKMLDILDVPPGFEPHGFDDVNKYRNVLDILDVPLGFEAHGSSGDKSILSTNRKKKIKLEDSSNPSSGVSVKKSKMLDILDVPPGFEPHGVGAVNKYRNVLDILDVPPGFEAHGSSGDKSILSTNRRKKIKLEDSSDPSSGVSVKKSKMLDILDVPPGFEPHGSSGDKSILSTDRRKKIKVEDSSDPSSGVLVKKSKMLDILDVPPGFEPHGSSGDKSILSTDRRKKIKLEDSSNPSSGVPVKKSKMLDILDVPPVFEPHGSSGDKSILSIDRRKKIKLEDSSDPSSGVPVKKSKMFDILDVPPGFEPHGFGAVNKYRNVLDILDVPPGFEAHDHRKKIKVEYSSDPSSESPVKKYHKVLDILDVPPGFEPHGSGAGKPSNIKR